MAGKTLIEYVHRVWKNFELRLPIPLDSRETITSFSSIDSEVPKEIRYSGLHVFDDESQRAYIVSDNGTQNFEVFHKIALITNITISGPIPVDAGNQYTYVWDHQLNSDTLNITVIDTTTGKQIPCEIEYIIQNNEFDKNSIQLNFSKYAIEENVQSLPSILITAQY